MPRNVNPGAAHLLAYGVAARGVLLVLLAALLMRLVASERRATVGTVDRVSLSAPRFGMPTTFDASAAALSSLRTAHALALWFDEAVIGRDGD
jgi:hypothetical protein